MRSAPQPLLLGAHERVRQRLRGIVGHLVADDGPRLGEQVARLRDQGFRVNVNLLGEAVLGEQQARERAAAEGVNEEAARAAGPVEIYSASFRPMQSLFAGRQDRMLMKLVVARDSRKVLGLTLSICAEAEARTLKPNTFGVGRM